MASRVVAPTGSLVRLAAVNTASASSGLSSSFSSSLSSLGSNCHLSFHLHARVLSRGVSSSASASAASVAAASRLRHSVQAGGAFGFAACLTNEVRAAAQRSSTPTLRSMHHHRRTYCSTQTPPPKTQANASITNHANALKQQALQKANSLKQQATAVQSNLKNQATAMQSNLKNQATAVQSNLMQKQQEMRTFLQTQTQAITNSPRAVVTSIRTSIQKVTTTARTAINKQLTRLAAIPSSLYAKLKPHLPAFLSKRLDALFAAISRQLSAIAASPATARTKISQILTSLWQQYRLTVAGTTLVLSAYVLWRSSFAVAKQVVGLSETFAEFGILALASLSTVLVAYVGMRRYYSLDGETVFRLAMRRLNACDRVRDAIGHPLTASELRAYVITGGGLKWGKTKSSSAAATTTAAAAATSVSLVDMVRKYIQPSSSKPPPTPPPQSTSQTPEKVLTGKNFWSSILNFFSLPKYRSGRLHMLFPIRSLSHRGVVSLTAKKKNGRYVFKLLAVDLPAKAAATHASALASEHAARAAAARRDSILGVGGFGGGVGPALYDDTSLLPSDDRGEEYKRIRECAHGTYAQPYRAARIYVDGDPERYEKDGVLSELRDPFLKSLDAQETIEAEDDEEEEQDEIEESEPPPNARVIEADVPALSEDSPYVTTSAEATSQSVAAAATLGNLKSQVIDSKKEMEQEVTADKTGRAKAAEDLRKAGVKMLLRDDVRLKAKESGSSTKREDVIDSVDARTSVGEMYFYEHAFEWFADRMSNLRRRRPVQ